MKLILKIYGSSNGFRGEVVFPMSRRQTNNGRDKAYYNIGSEFDIIITSNFPRSLLTKNEL
jgi:hypothetical protein